MSVSFKFSDYYHDNLLLTWNEGGKWPNKVKQLGKKFYNFYFDNSYKEKFEEYLNSSTDNQIKALLVLTENMSLSTWGISDCELVRDIVDRYDFDFSITDSKGHRLGDYLENYVLSSIDNMRTFVEKGGDINGGDPSFLHTALARGPTNRGFDFIKEMLALGADKTMMVDNLYPIGMTYMPGHFLETAKLLYDDKIDLNSEGGSGRTVLAHFLEVVPDNEIDAIEFILKKGADPNHVTIIDRSKLRPTLEGIENRSVISDALIGNNLSPEKLKLWFKYGGKIDKDAYNKHREYFVKMVKTMGGEIAFNKLKNAKYGINVCRLLLEDSFKQLDGLKR